MKKEDELDRNLEALRLERAPQPAADQESAELLALALAVRRLRSADSVPVPAAPALRAVSGRRRYWLAAGTALVAAAVVFLLVIAVRPVDVVHAAQERLTALTTYHTVGHFQGFSIDPQNGEKRHHEWRMEIWYDRGKYRIQIDEDLLIFDGDTEWHVLTEQRRVTQIPGLPQGRMQMSTVDDLVKWFTEYPHVVEGEERFNGRPAFRVAVQLRSDVTQYVWLDKRSFLPVGGRSVNKEGEETSWTEQMEVNVPIDPVLFTYQPPEGFTVDVLGRR